VVATIDAIQRDLTDDGLVLRYRSDGADDGLPGGEGVFVACSFWLVGALHGAGRVPEAAALFERLLTLRNDVGLFSEEWDTTGQRQLGNTPPADLSHDVRSRGPGRSRRLLLVGGFTNDGVNGMPGSAWRRPGR